MYSKKLQIEPQCVLGDLAINHIIPAAISARVKFMLKDEIIFMFNNRF